MATVDDKVVAMSFENSKFESGVHSTLSSLDKLKNALKFQDAGKGLTNLAASTNKMDLSHIGNSVDAIKNKFSALNAAATAAIFNLTNRMINAGSQFVKSFTFAPIMDGLHEYETNLNSVQTILANTQASGAKLKDVNSALQQLNTYSDKTIYNFGQMAKNIGTFTAAGVDLDTAVASIKGISNLAALSGSNAEQASTAMYQLSQAISAGRVGLQDWNSVVNAGMGGTVFQRALAQTAEKMGTLSKGAVTLKGKMKNVSIEGKSFRESIQAGPGKKSWLTSDVLTKTLTHFTGDLTNAQLAAEGFNAAEIKAIQAQAKTAQDAATQVKTLGQVFAVAKETMGSGWAKTFQTIFGDFGEAKKTFTALSNSVNGFINASADARNKILGDWKALGGRKILLEGIKDAFHNLSAVVKPIKDAFRDIFPKKTGQDLLDLTKKFGKFAEALKPSPQTVENLRRTFRGFFAILDIGKQIIGGIFTAIGKLFGTLGKGSGDTLALTGNVGDMIVAFDKWLKQGDKIKTFFGRLGDALAFPVRLIGTLTGKLNGLFGAGDGNAAGGIASSFANIGAALKPGEKAIDAATAAWDSFLKVLERVGNVIRPVLDSIGNTFSQIGSVIADAIKTNNFDPVFDVIQTALVGGIFLTLKKALGGGALLKFDFGGSAVKSMSKSLDILRGSLTAIQQNIKANTLLQISAAVALLAAAVVALSLVKPDKLTSSMTAITVGLGQLMGAMALLTKIGGAKGFIKLPIITASLILLAIAIDTLAIAVLVLSRLSWDELARGLSGVAGLLLVVSLAVKPLSKAGPGLVIAGVGLTALGVALNVIALAVKIFSTMSWEELAKGLSAVTVALIGIGVGVRAIPPSILLVGPGLIALGAALAIIAGAVKLFGSMDLATLGKGIGAVAASLVVIGLAVSLMPPTLPLTAAGLILVGIALTSIAGAIALMGSMDVSTLAKGIGGIGAALLVLALGLTAMIASLPGAAALLVAAAALALLVPVLGILGRMSWATIGKGLAAIAAALLTISIVGAVAAPGLLILGAALIVLAGAVSLVGAGVYLLASGLVKLGGEGSKGIAVTIAALTALIAILPKVIISFIKGLVEILAEIAKVAPAIVDSLVKIIKSLLAVIIKASPQFALAAIALITAILKIFTEKAPDIIKAGWGLLKALLRGISNNIGAVTKMVANIITKFLGALTSKIPQLVSAGANVLAAWIKGIANNIAKVVTAAVSIITKFLGAIASGLGKVAAAGLSILTKLLGAITSNLSRVISMGTTIIVRLVKGIANAASKIATAALNTVTHFIQVMAREFPKKVNQVATAIIKMMNALAGVIRQREPEFIGAVGNIGHAIVAGIVDGMTGLGGKILNKIKDEILSLPGKGVKLVTKALGKIAAALPLPDGLARAFGVSFTNEMAGHLRIFEEKFQKELATIGGASNIQFLFNMGNTLASSFRDGLLSGIDRGTIDPILQAGSDIVNQISSDQQDIENAILESTQKIRAANTALDKDYEAKRNAKKIKDKSDRKDKLASIEEDIKQQKAIRAEAGKTLAANEQLLAILAKTSAFILFDPSYKEMISKLAAAKAEVIRLNDELEKQTGILDDLKSKRQSLFDQTFEKFSALPGLVTEDANGNPIDPATQVQNYINSLSGADDVVGKFTATLDTLQGMGLNAETYQQLLDIGPAAQGFADALVAMGPDAVAAINGADRDLRNAASVLANHGADEMYKVGIDTAMGLVTGLKVKIPEAVKTAEDLAEAIVKAIKRKLKIKSPSEVFAEIGAYSVKGMAKGFTNSSKVVNAAVGKVAESAITTMKNSLGDMSDVIDVNPTITPVLDLTNIQNGAKSLDSLLNVIPITAAASFGQASSISSEQEAAQLLKDVLSAEASSIKFEQNNYSPESLSSIEIYRQTRNQLAQAKSVLAT